MSSSTARVVLLDVDEVLFAFAHAYDRWLRKNAGFGLDPGHLSRYNIPAAAGPEHDRWIVEFLADPAVIYGEAVIPAARAALSELSVRFKLIACTSRHGHDEGAATRTWLQTHVPSVEDVVFTRYRRGEPGQQKTDVARNLNAAMLVDDSPEHLVGLPDGCSGVLLRRPHGLPSPKGASCWRDVLRAVEQAHKE